MENRRLPPKQLSNDWVEAKTQLRKLSKELRPYVSKDPAFWKSVDSGKGEKPDLETANANYEKLVSPLVQFALDANNEINKTFALAG